MTDRMHPSPRQMEAYQVSMTVVVTMTMVTQAGFSQKEQQEDVRRKALKRIQQALDSQMLTVEALVEASLHKI